MINSSSVAASKNAYEQLNGTLSAKINKLKEIFVFVMANIDVDIDFPEADIEVVDRGMIVDKLNEAKKTAQEMLSSVDEGRVIKEGIRVAICGLPNAGKSSLLNLLLGEDRAIVTEIPGTTRDIIEESLTVNGVRVRLFDTAGIRNSSDKVEAIGIERTKRVMSDCDIVLVMLDGSEDVLSDDNRILLEETESKKNHRIVVVNKSDVAVNKSVTDELEKNGMEYIVISALTGSGIEQLKNAIYDKALGSTGTESVCLTNARQIHCLNKCMTALDDALNDVEFAPLDIVGINIREAYEDILELVGESIDDSIINEIFMSFCLGK